MKYEIFFYVNIKSFHHPARIYAANILRKYSIERFNYTRYLNTSNILSFRVLCTHESSRGLQIETSMKKSRKRFVNEKQNGK